ncbi:MAG: CDP-alcohol phosphatidyltransferase family protein [Candidatus Aenigmarchaeota archaeon]|nr:CDP-alcohol phosphatidyltransferase family protein [Candidatus Aenigmarchaeota archaeon]
MTLYAERQRFEQFSLRIGVAFSRIDPVPNHWTVFSLVPTVVALWFLVQEAFLAAAGLFIIAAFLDVVDGSVARVMGKVTRLGAYLDTIVDRYVEGIILFGLLFASLPALAVAGVAVPAAALVFLLFFGGALTTYAKAAAKEKDLIDRELRGGLLERAERLLILFIGILLASVEPVYLTYVLALLAVLSNVTALQRITKAARAPPPAHQ